MGVVDFANLIFIFRWTQSIYIQTQIYIALHDVAGLIALHDYDLFCEFKVVAMLLRYIQTQNSPNLLPKFKHLFIGSSRSNDANDPSITLNSIAGGINPIPAFLSRIVQPSASLTRANSGDCGANGDALG